MLFFKANFLPGLASGDVTLTFRLWDKPRVKAGSMQRCHPIGVLEVGAVDEVKLGKITSADAKRAGFDGRDALVANLAEYAKTALGPTTVVYRVELCFIGDGDQAANANDADLTADEVDELTRVLAKLDGASPWTRATMKLIEEHPKVAASQLAAKVERETPPFKSDVVKLKKLGLTTSFEVGYELSPRGRAYVATLSKARRVATKSAGTKTTKTKK